MVFRMSLAALAALLVQVLAVLSIHERGISAKAQAVPIPATYDGYSQGPAGAAVHVEFFYDLMCPNCRDSWPAINRTMQHFRNSGDLRITMHTFPLPYHHNAFLVAQVAHALGENKIWDWMEVIYANQEKFGNAATADMTREEVQAALGDLAENHGLPRDVVLNGLKSSDVDQATRVSWKYACYRGVSGTPTYLVNGVPAPTEAGGWSSTQWIRFIDQIRAQGVSQDIFHPNSAVQS
mmetsp:Transcript_11250/g.21958  ORF Transcript_11250/g.21958 Transcript_11250/m.21958 type:complete len:237 (-) Transcript_11250:48-758(-)